MAAVLLGGYAQPVGMGGGLDSAFEQEANRVRDEERYVAECMRAKGYRDAR